jgi:hypothetical protein
LGFPTKTLVPALNLGLKGVLKQAIVVCLVSPFLPYLTFDGVRRKRLKRGLQINRESNQKHSPFSFHTSRAGQIHTGLHNPWNFWSGLNKTHLLLNQLCTDSGTEFQPSGRTGLEYLVEHRSKEVRCTVPAHTNVISDFFILAVGETLWGTATFNGLIWTHGRQINKLGVLAT